MPANSRGAVDLQDIATALKSAQAYDLVHVYSDKDYNDQAIHHTLGTRPEQAAFGNHGHLSDRVNGFVGTNSAKSINNASFIQLNYTTEIGMYVDNVSDTSGVFTVPIAGLWAVKGSAIYFSNAGGTHRLLLLITSAGEEIRVSGPVGMNGNQGMSFSSIFNFAVGNAVSMQAYQDQGSALNFEKIRFAVQYLGKV